MKTETDRFIRKAGSSCRKWRGGKVFLIATGLASTVWFLVRVIPKPSRAAYPCMRAAAPFMSAFILYLVGLGTSAFAFRRAWRRLLSARILSFLAFLCLAAAAAFSTLLLNQGRIKADAQGLMEGNQPIGIARGIFPGRVVWEWNPDATNGDCTNEFGDAWDLPQNTDAALVDSMVAASLHKLTGAGSLREAWDSLFIYLNERHGKPRTGYQPGEMIFIKANFVGGHRNRMDDRHARIPHSRYGNSQTSPQVILAVLRHLVDVCGIPQENIYLGDPSKNIFKNTWDMLHTPYPNVNYVAELNEMGRLQAVPGKNPVLFYSDRGSVLGKSEDYLCSFIDTADYLINLSALKGHERAGITLCAKNHFGSHMSADASHLHPGLVQEAPGYGKYRVLVDMMAHEKLGGNTLLFLVDGLWSSPDANLKPVKWQSKPFNGDWTSSILVSLDQVALESVCYDLLKNEYTVENSAYPYPQAEGTEDYLLQAADSAFWPQGLVYDPEGDGTSFYSLGVHEHWNNPDEMKYSRDLGTGNGIELIRPEVIDSTPGTPGMLNVVSVSGNRVDLDWEDKASNEDFYIVEFSARTTTAFQFLDTLPANSTSCTCENLSPRIGYYFRVKAVNNGFASAYSNTVYAYVPGTTSLEQPEENARIRLYPNPAGSTLKLEFSGGRKGTLQVSLYSSEGKLAGNWFLEKTTREVLHTMDLSGLAEGTYHLSVVCGDVRITRQLLKISEGQ